MKLFFEDVSIHGEFSVCLGEFLRHLSPIIVVVII
jgi:hypothetical protein